MTCIAKVSRPETEPDGYTTTEAALEFKIVLIMFIAFFATPDTSPTDQLGSRKSPLAKSGFIIGKKIPTEIDGSRARVENLDPV